ncbi:MAG: polysaccharide biosynthesis tyrosine autokinase, partial [Aeromicrobium sp.]
KRLLANLRKEYDFVLIDAPPLLPVADAALLAAESDGAILVVRHGGTTKDQVAAAVGRLQSVGARLIGTVISMSPEPRHGRSGYGYGYGYGYAPEAGRAKSEGKPKGKSRSKRANASAPERLLGQDQPQVDPYAEAAINPREPSAVNRRETF